MTTQREKRGGNGKAWGQPWLLQGSARQSSHSQPSRWPQCLLHSGHRRLTLLLRTVWQVGMCGRAVWRLTQGEDGVTEARQWDQTCYVKQARWAAKASSGFCKCSWWWPQENPSHHSSRSLLLPAGEGDHFLHDDAASRRRLEGAQIQLRCWGGHWGTSPSTAGGVWSGWAGWKAVQPGLLKPGHALQP